MEQSCAEVLILLGGGIDSSALIPFYLSRGMKVQGVHFNYGQPSAVGERRSVIALSDYYNIPVFTVDLKLPIVCVNWEYRGRNALLLLAAANVISAGPILLSIAIHAGTPYYDCSRTFLMDMARIFDGYFGGTIGIEAPFIDFTKPDIFEFCLQNEVPISLTYSCERHAESPCGECPSCKDREMLYAGYRNLQGTQSSGR